MPLFTQTNPVTKWEETTQVCTPGGGSHGAILEGGYAAPQGFRVRKGEQVRRVTEEKLEL